MKSNADQVKRVKTLEDLQSACEELLDVKIVLPSKKGVQTMLVGVRMLRPAETEQLELILKEAHPPLQDVPQPDGSVRKEYIPDPKTLEKAARLQKEARAMALWWCCPIFSASDEGQAIVKRGAQRSEIVTFIQSKFTESILEKLYTITRAEEFDLEDRINFTSPLA